MRAVLRKELDLPIVDMADKTATLDGGDVLFTGIILEMISSDLLCVISQLT